MGFHGKMEEPRFPFFQAFSSSVFFFSLQSFRTRRRRRANPVSDKRLISRLIKKLRGCVSERDQLHVLLMYLNQGSLTAEICNPVIDRVPLSTAVVVQLLRAAERRLSELS